MPLSQQYLLTLTCAVRNCTATKAGGADDSQIPLLKIFQPFYIPTNTAICQLNHQRIIRLSAENIKSFFLQTQKRQLYTSQTNFNLNFLVFKFIFM